MEIAINLFKIMVIIKMEEASSRMVVEPFIVALGAIRLTNGSCFNSIIIEKDLFIKEYCMEFTHFKELSYNILQISFSYSKEVL